jgi:hypothetical protein
MYKIYEIRCNETGEVYIGKTTRTLNDRLLEHKSHLRCCSKQIIERDNYYIKEIDSTFDEEESIRLERYYIETYDCVNFKVPGRTEKEWKEENKDEIRVKNKIWREENKNEIRVKSKIWREENKNEISKKKKKNIHVNVVQLYKKIQNHNMKKLKNTKTL